MSARGYGAWIPEGTEFANFVQSEGTTVDHTKRREIETGQSRCDDGGGEDSVSRARREQRMQGLGAATPSVGRGHCETGKKMAQALRSDVRRTGIRGGRVSGSRSGTSYEAQSRQAVLFDCLRRHGAGIVGILASVPFNLHQLSQVAVGHVIVVVLTEKSVQELPERSFVDSLVRAHPQTSALPA